MLIFLIFLTASCNRYKFGKAGQLIPAKDRAIYQTIYLIGENSCNACYGHILNADKKNSIVYIFSKSGDENSFKSFFDNLKVQRSFTLLDFAATYTKDFKGPYKINIQNEEIIDIISFNN
ncbi:MAG: hypothetical protein EOO20_01070 [Chryseobacterium sp.]|nr:MAG: hypothetical protein EOO20_01070 [Chryseobacterium sp.]